MTRRSRSWVVLGAILALLGCGSSSDDSDGSANPLPGSGTGAATSGSTANPGTGGTVAGGAGQPAGAGTAAAGGGGTIASAGGTTGAGTTGGGAGTTGAGGSGGTPTSCGAAVPNMAAGNACPGTPPPAIKLTMIVGGLVSPTYVAQAPGDPSRLYVLEQGGSIKVVKDGAVASTLFMDTRDLAAAPVNADTIIATYGESGLMNMVFDPNFATTKRYWISYTKGGPAFTVAEFKMTDPDVADVTSYKELLSFPQYPFLPVGEGTNHLGSQLAFGPDGCLYISRGDGGGENDRQMSGQKTSDDLCSILRVDVDKFPTAVAGNKEGHVWSYGFRNPWRFSFDSMSGDMYIGDVGQDVGTGFEEVNIEPRGMSGRNYGWSVTAGPTGGTPDMTKPAVSYGITDTQNSVIGGYVYRGTKMPGMVGRYIWADWTERKIKTLVYKGEMNGAPMVCDEFETGVVVPTKVRSFGQGIDGEIYVVAGGAPTSGLSSAGPNEAGTLYRIDPM